MSTLRKNLEIVPTPFMAITRRRDCEAGAKDDTGTSRQTGLSRLQLESSVNVDLRKIERSLKIA